MPKCRAAQPRGHPRRLCKSTQPRPFRRGRKSHRVPPRRSSRKPSQPVGMECRPAPAGIESGMHTRRIAYGRDPRPTAPSFPPHHRRTDTPTAAPGNRERPVRLLDFMPHTRRTPELPPPARHPPRPPQATLFLQRTRPPAIAAPCPSSTVVGRAMDTDLHPAARGPHCRSLSGKGMRLCHGVRGSATGRKAGSHPARPLCRILALRDRLPRSLPRQPAPARRKHRGTHQPIPAGPAASRSAAPTARPSGRNPEGHFLPRHSGHRHARGPLR